MGRLLLFLLVLIGAIAGYSYWATHQEAQIDYPTKEVAVRDIVEVVAVSGSAEPEKTYYVESLVPGIINEVFVDYGTQVTKDQVLAKLDDEAEQVALRAAQEQKATAELAVQLARKTVESADAGVKVAQASVAAAERQLNKARELEAKDVVPASTVDAARDAFTVASSQALLALTKKGEANENVALAQQRVNEAQVAIAGAETKIAMTEIKARADGTVEGMNATIGEKVGTPSLNVSLTGGGGPKGLFEIAAPLDRMQAVVQVSEVDSARVAPGQHVDFSVDAYPDEKFAAHVDEIRNTTSDSGSTAVNYDIVLKFDNRRVETADGAPGRWMVRPRATVTADIVIREVGDVLAVPTAAFRFVPDEEELQNKVPKTPGPNEQVVWSKGPGGKPRMHVVRIGLNDGEWAQLLDNGGLQRGDEVITAKTYVKKQGIFGGLSIGG